ncbi:nuclear transport factor 2 family protein [Pelagibius litoralis]|uniref:Nuclear transport factor 2 family protein n=1 Tax=Pelagibius litoralis TaxID=374515 RepID=A0A967F004_9PROT|nr:nuclear transport factor 2 family protein [Pelagibius litoralis]NIA70517.1 nuclear transport factor 2 family protein [Pelagibius litoralis]
MIDFRSSRLMTLSACVLAIAATTMTAQADQPDATAANEAVVRQAFETWTEGTYVFNELLAPDVVWTIHGSGPVAGTYTNMDDFVERAAKPLTSRLVSPLVPEVHDIWAQKDTVIIRFDGSAITTSGTPYNNQFVWIFQMENGLVTEAEAFLDLLAYQEVVDNNAPRAD